MFSSSSAVTVHALRKSRPLIDALLLSIAAMWERPAQCAGRHNTSIARRPSGSTGAAHRQVVPVDALRQGAPGHRLEVVPDLLGPLPDRVRGVEREERV